MELRHLLIGVCGVALALLVIFSLPVVAFYATRNTPKPGYGASAYSGTRLVPGSMSISTATHAMAAARPSG